MVDQSLITEPKYKGGSCQVEVTEPKCRDESGQVETSNQWGVHTVSLATKECGPRLLGANSDQGDRIVQISTIG